MSVEVINFGCRLNVYEGEVIKQQAHAGGLKDAIVFNSCAVTKEAERQVKQAIRKARREQPGKRIIVTGCSAQIDAAQYLDMEEVSAVLGNEDKLHAANYQRLSEIRSESVDEPALSASEHTAKAGELAASCASQQASTEALKKDSPPYPPASGGAIFYEEERAIVNDIMSVKETAGHLITSVEGHSRAFVQVQNGCDHRCTFCIIPYGRGNSRSVPAGEVVNQIQILVEQGYKEVVLTGVDVSDYGNGLPGDMTLGELCKKILKLVPELPRLRISSIDAVEVDDTLLELIANEERLMPHLHLSLQAGNDMILKRMKRRHLRKDIIGFCNHVRKLRSDMVYGADIIAGFPTETDEMFEDTLNLIDEVGLTYLHVFPYSERPGTPAEKMPQVPKALRKERAACLRVKGKEQEQRLYQSLVGTTQQVLMEQGGIGHTPGFAAVQCSDGKPGELVELAITADMVM